MIEWILNAIKFVLKAFALLIGWTFFMAIISSLLGDIGILIGFITTIAIIIFIIYKNRYFNEDDNKKEV